MNDAGLARPLDGGRGVWELSHDFVAHAVARFLGRQSGNLRRYALAYAAPALLAITLAVSVGAAVWETSNTARLRAELNDLAVMTSLGRNGLDALTLTGTPVANLEPLKGLTALQKLDLNGTQVKTLEPIYNLPNLRREDVQAPEFLRAQLLKYRITNGIPD